MQGSEFGSAPPSGKSQAPVRDVSCRVCRAPSSLHEIRPTPIGATAGCIISGAMSVGLDSW